MKKPRTQPAFSSLTEAELEQVADWLRHETYEVVLDRLRRPRTEGGFGLTVSRSPLERLYTKIALLDLINSRIEASAPSTDKKLTLAQFESIAAGETFLLASQQNDKCKMLDTPCSMNEPAADGLLTPGSDLIPQSAFRIPQCSHIHSAILNTACDLATSSENTSTQLLALQRLADFPARAELRARREQRHAEAHSWRSEAHSWKRESHALKKEMHQCRLDTAAHRKHIAEERLALAKSALELRQKQIALRSDQNPQSALASPARTRNAPSSFVPWTAEDILHNQPKVEEAIRNDPFLSQIGLPPEDPPTLCSGGNETLTPSKDPSSKTSSETLSNSADPSAPSAVKTPPPSLEERCNSYTLARHREATIGKNADIVGRWASYTFISNLQRCPCGELLPCPDHGDFPHRFFEIFPDHPDYILLFHLKKLPYTSPYELLRQEAALPVEHDSPTSAHQNVELNSFEMQA
jgi:hypothetical protein